MEKQIKIIIYILKTKEELYMELVEKQPIYIFKELYQLNNIENIVDILMCFLSKGSSLIFGCIDMEFFINNLDSEDLLTQSFYRKLIEYNKNNYGTDIMRDDEEEKENEKFIEVNTVFTLDKVDFPLCNFGQNRRTIWYKTSSRQEIIKALKINNLFKCIILKDNDLFDDYQYALELDETDEGKNLVIMEKDKGSFMNMIYHKIIEVIEKQK